MGVVIEVFVKCPGGPTRITVADITGRRGGTGLWVFPGHEMGSKTGHRKT